MSSTVSTSRGVYPLPGRLGTCESPQERSSIPFGQSEPELNGSDIAELLSVSWNQDYGCFAVGTTRGFRIYNCDPFKETFRRDLKRGGFGIVEMLFRCNILALVGGAANPQYPSNKVMIWDDHQSRCIGEFSFRSEVRAVKLRRDCIVVVLEHKIYVYNFMDLKLLHQIETLANPRGLCCLSHQSNTSVLVCPGLQRGQVRIEHFGLKMTKFINAHDSHIACFTLTMDGLLLATSSTKGTLIRIFNTMDGSRLQEVRRGVDKAEIYSLALSPNVQWLAVSSDKGTVHIFGLRVRVVGEDASNQLSTAAQDSSLVHQISSTSLDSLISPATAANPGSSLSFMKVVLPKYFSSEWSFAQIHLPEITRFVAAFGSQNTVVMVGMDGRCSFDPLNGGEMAQQEKLPSRPVLQPQFRCGASSSFPDYIIEPLLGETKKKRSIAGIDQDELLDPIMLADPDSCFCDFNGVHIHHKIFHEQEQEQQVGEGERSQTTKLGLPMILLHGFGASLFSWDRVTKPLARLTGSKVLAFDRPAFGLTSRVTTFDDHSTASKEDKQTLNPYSMAFSVLATLHFINFLSADMAILTGHSAGCLVAVDAYFKAPDRVAAMILVAPAILTPRTLFEAVKENQAGAERQTKDGSNSSNIKENQLMRIGIILSKFSMYILQSIMRFLKGMVNIFNVYFKKALTTILRSSLAVMLLRVVIDKFGIAGVRNAWYDGSQLTDHTINGYIKPLRAKGWDRALIEVIVAMVMDSGSESKPPLTKRLNEISCPVLIITGDNDRIVPSWNAKRLSQAIPGSSLEIIKNCGHLPHEERVEEFVSVVQQFLQRISGAAEEQLLQAPT
ncbi:hypothetical protein GIB67_000062 [Kingdonia uniflora]|uniref:AB hydrolase-1 domain-containing protein n=1 Tax=Kingdonia uniflora TaxID=39325 RepID=A0A7J7NWV2_9MAGN|nr:hypothetical protein GIB67_041063 [Kingdonia uniflora]KAF6171675.1 hypothetical protein GIB67_000062 [Kingdonia uniflora]